MTSTTRTRHRPDSPRVDPPERTLLRTHRASDDGERTCRRREAAGRWLEGGIRIHEPLARLMVFKTDYGAFARRDNEAEMCSDQTLLCCQPASSALPVSAHEVTVDHVRQVPLQAAHGFLVGLARLPLASHVGLRLRFLTRTDRGELAEP